MKYLVIFGKLSVFCLLAVLANCSKNQFESMTCQELLPRETYAIATNLLDPIYLKEKNNLEEHEVQGVISNINDLLESMRNCQMYFYQQAQLSSLETIRNENFALADQLLDMSFDLTDVVFYLEYIFDYDGASPWRVEYEEFKLTWGR